MMMSQSHISIACVKASSTERILYAIRDLTDKICSRPQRALPSNATSIGSLCRMDSLTDIQWMVKNDKVAFATATYKNEIIPKEKGEYINHEISDLYDAGTSPLFVNWDEIQKMITSFLQKLTLGSIKYLVVFGALVSLLKKFLALLALLPASESLFFFLCPRCTPLDSQ